MSMQLAYVKTGAGSEIWVLLATLLLQALKLGAVYVVVRFAVRAELRRRSKFQEVG